LIEIRRYEKTNKGTLGTLWLDNEFLCYTLEDPDNNNAKGISCIPEGTYLVNPHNGTKYKNVWILRDVPNREAILIHQGNTINDTRGCILVGRKVGVIKGLPAVLESRLALDDLRNKLPKSFHLTIRSIK
jgi:hypothetical protein